MKKYGVALIGCGQMGAVHLEQIYYKQNVSIRCVCDHDRSRAEDFARRFHAERVETDADACIQRDDVDVVIIATYPSSHLPLLKCCIQNHKHVICEKPIASTKEDGEEFIRLIKEHPECKVLVGLILRHNETYRKVAQMIQEGAIGSPIVMRMSQNHHTKNWGRYLSLIQETSPIIDCGVHYLDVMRWVTGAEITSVNGVSARTEMDVPEGHYNYGMITVTLSDGSVGFYEAGWSNTLSSENFKEFSGPRGTIRIVFAKDRHTHQEEGDLIEYYQYPEQEYHIINLDSCRKPTHLQFDYLVKMIEENAPAFPSVDDVEKSFYWTMQADQIIAPKKNVF